VQSQGSRYLSVVVLALSVLARVDVAMADEATGTVNYKGRTATLKYAYLVKGPDEMDQETIIRRVILSQTDIGADIQACTTLGCCTNNLTEGVTVDIDAGPLNIDDTEADGPKVEATFDAALLKEFGASH
jgi:hypothetical protein